MRRHWFVIPPVLALALLTLGPVAALAATAAHWGMNEPAGTGTMFDDSGNGNHGTWQDITANGASYQFNGSTSRVVVPDDPSLDPGFQRFSYYVRFKTSVVPSAAVGDYDLLRKGLGSTAGGYFKVEVYPNADHTKGRALCQMQGTTGAAKLVGSANLANGVWHTIRCAKDSSGLTMFVDGVKVGFKAAAIGSIANSAPLTMGAKSIGGDWYTGRMDQAGVTIG
jgi:Concanavalin A-like lectin/glucanases superfamily